LQYHTYHYINKTTRPKTPYDLILKWVCYHPTPQPTKVQPFKVNTLVFYSGAGGATAGFLESGKSNVLAAFDNDSTACRIHQALYPLVKMVQYDLHGEIKHTMAKIAKVSESGASLYVALTPSAFLPALPRPLFRKPTRRPEARHGKHSLVPVPEAFQSHGCSLHQHRECAQDA
jgi:hypothetical protein